ncbi:MAG: divalent-cation tolerance protein CutA [Betaproteobacteria bacterium]
MAGAAILILTQMPDWASAQSLARILVESRLAACVSIGMPVESLYHWRGEIETAQEIPVAVKTQPERYAEVEAAIRERHPYELPEILAVPVVHGLAPYLDWIAAETAAG